MIPTVSPVHLQCLQGLRVPTTGAGKGLGSRGGGATLQRSKLDMRQKQQTWEPKLDSGSGGGGIGKNIFNGGAFLVLSCCRAAVAVGCCGRGILQSSIAPMLTPTKCISS